MLQADPNREDFDSSQKQINKILTSYCKLRDEDKASAVPTTHDKFSFLHKEIKVF